MVGDDDPGVGLVIPQQHVVAGLVLLDEVVLEDQRLGLGVGDRYLHIGNLAHQGAGLDAVDVGPKVGGEPFFQILGLAHVDDGAAAVVHAVDTALVGDGAQKCLAVKMGLGREGHRQLDSTDECKKTGRAYCPQPAKSKRRPVPPLVSTRPRYRVSASSMP